MRVGEEVVVATQSQRTTADFASYAEAAWPRLFRTAYALTGSRADAEDAVQTVLAKAYASWWRVGRADSIDAYVRRMLINHVTSLRRRPWRSHELTSDAPPDLPLPDPQDRLGDVDVVWRAIRALPPRQRAVVVLRYYDDLTEAQIAATLDIAPGTVKSQCSAAMRALRSALESERAGGDR